MKQQDFFETTLEKKILRMEKWITRLQKELWFLKEVNNLKERSERMKTDVKQIIKQIDMFAS